MVKAEDQSNEGPRHQNGAHFKPFYEEMSDWEDVVDKVSLESRTKTTSSPPADMMSAFLCYLRSSQLSPSTSEKVGASTKASAKSLVTVIRLHDSMCERMEA